MRAEWKSHAVPALRSDVVSEPALEQRLRQKLQEGLACMGLPLTKNQQNLLIQYLALLVRWNATYNLTAVRDPCDMLALHVFDSLAIVDLVRDSVGLDVLDVGTGAGLPGVPLAIALPEHRVQLVDAVAKKISFLQQVKSSLKLVNIHPRHVRIEALTLAREPDIIVSRAYSDLAKMIRSIEHVAADSTTVIAMKGLEPTGELDALPASWRVVELRTLDVPFVGAHRCAVVLRRAP